MKVLLDGHMLGQQKTGIERYWKNLITELQNCNVDLCIYSNRPKDEILKLYNFKRISFYTPFISNGLYRILFGFSKAIQFFKPDLIHVNNFGPILKTIPTITTVHDLCFLSHPQTFSLKSQIAFQLFFKKTLYDSDQIISVSNTVKNQLIQFYNLNPVKIHTIHEAVDPAFKHIKNQNNIRSILNHKFKIYKKYFLVVGNIEARKNIIPIIRAFLHVQSQIPNIQLVFTGNNLLQKELAVYKTQIQKNIIRILNFISDYDLNILYNGAESIIFNSFCEGFGLPLVEAIACKTPIVCNDISIFREIAGPYANYIKSELEMSEIIQKILIDKTLKKQYSKLTKKKKNVITWKYVAQETFNIYKSVIKYRT